MPTGMTICFSARTFSPSDRRIRGTTRAPGCGCLAGGTGRFGRLSQASRACELMASSAARRWRTSTMTGGWIWLSHKTGRRRGCSETKRRPEACGCASTAKPTGWGYACGCVMRTEPRGRCAWCRRLPVIGRQTARRRCWGRQGRRWRSRLLGQAERKQPSLSILARWKRCCPTRRSLEAPAWPRCSPLSLQILYLLSGHPSGTVPL